MTDADALALVTRALGAAFPDRAEPMLDAVERAFRMSGAPRDESPACVLCGGHGVPRFPVIRAATGVNHLGAVVSMPGMQPWQAQEATTVACLDCLAIAREEHSSSPFSDRVERLAEDVRRAMRASGLEQAESAIRRMEDAFARAGGPVLSREFHPGCFLCGETKPCAQGAAKGALCDDCSRDHWRAISTDGLTGAATRALFAARLDAAIARARRMSRPLAILMVDVDWMKSWNDFHGFMVGDALLTRVPGIMRSGLRAGDLVARWGGEEFVAILPDRIVSEAAAIGEAIRARAFDALRPPDLPFGPEEARWFESQGRTHLAEGRATVSIGVAGLTPDAGFADLLRAADDRVNDAKLAGRNRVAG